MKEKEGEQTSKAFWAKEAEKELWKAWETLLKLTITVPLEVGDLKKRTRSFEVRRPKCEEEEHEVSIREGPEELTLRSEEVRSQKSCINVDHTAQERWDHLWLMLIGMHSARRSTKVLKWQRLGGIVRSIQRNE